MTVEEQERLAYVSGDTTTAALLARLDDMHYALGQGVAALGEINRQLSKTSDAAEEGLIMVKRAGG